MRALHIYACICMPQADMYTSTLLPYRMQACTTHINFMSAIREFIQLSIDRD